ncbi:MAG: hypothetical protein ABI402_14050 [Ferruginibacter sp.]
MKYITSIAVSIFFLFFSGCNNDDPENNRNVENNPGEDNAAINKNPVEETTMLNDTNTIKVYVDRTGKITAGGNPTDLVSLDSAFNTLKKNKGTVYYSRDQVQGDPPAESMKVIELVAKYRLPVKFFTDKTFTQDVNFK